MSVFKPLFVNGSLCSRMGSVQQWAFEISIEISYHYALYLCYIVSITCNGKLPMIRTAAIFLIQLPSTIANYSVGFFYAQWTHRYLLYFAACMLIGVWTYAALEVYGWLTWRVTSISFRGNHILHTMVNFGLCFYVVDEWLARLTGRWGRFNNRTLGKQALIWGMSFAIAFYFQRTVVFEWMQYYSLDIYHYYEKYPKMRPVALNHFLFCLPFFLSTIILLWTIAFIRQRGLLKERKALVPAPSAVNPKETLSTGKIDEKLPPLYIQSGSDQIILEQTTISHVTVEDHYCRIHTVEEDEVKSYFIKSSLADILDKLLDSHFIQVHRSHVVNVNAIRKLDKKNRSSRVCLKSDVVLPVSRHRLTEVIGRIQDAMEQGIN